MKRPFLNALLAGAIAAATFAGFSNRLAAQSGQQNTQFLPTGAEITPTAAKGSLFQPLNPDLPARPDLLAGQAVTTAVSPDGSTLLILTSGYNLNDDADGRIDPAASTEYVFIYDISQNPPKKVQVLQVPNTFNGLCWSPSGRAFYVSGGMDDNVHVFAKAEGRWRESVPPIALGHAQGLGIRTKPLAAGLAVNAAGTRLLVANYYNDSVSLVDLRMGKKIAELDLRPGKNNPREVGVAGGEFPFWVAVMGNQKAYAASVRDREIVVLDLAARPRIASRIKVLGSPNKMILNRDQSRLFVALDNSDLVAIIDTDTDRVVKLVPVTAPPAVFRNPGRFRGSNPNSLALAPDEETLYVTNGGTNSVAVVRLDEVSSGIAVIGLIPTGWYPNAVSLNRDGTLLYVVNGKSPAGPNPRGCRNTTSLARGELDACHAANQYVWQLTKAGFLTLPVPSPEELARLTAQVARNNHFVGVAARGKDNSFVEFLRSKIKHVIYIVKENRTYDQVLGDLEKGNGDPSLAMLPDAITPNHHQLARQFVTLDNFYDSGEVSGDGWNWSTAARTTDALEKAIPVQYASRGPEYDYEGGNRSINVGIPTLAERRAANPVTPDDPDLLPGTVDVAAPDSPGGQAGAGYLWDDALRAGLTVRNYGFFLDLTRYSASVPAPLRIPPLHDPYAAGTVVAFPAKAALKDITDPYFRGFDQALPDHWRFKEWEREFDAYVQNHNLPSLELVRLPHDHFGSFAEAIDGVNTVETEMADNDYALGLLVEKVSRSIYKDDTLIFVVEDDAQNGPDHVDAHRSVAYVIGPYVRQKAVVSERYTTVNMLRTMEDVLGIPPLSLSDSSVEPMTAVFGRDLLPWTYTPIVPAVLHTTQLPLPPVATSGSTTTSAAPKHDAAYWTAKTRGLDFSVEDHLDTARFNRILWTGLMGMQAPYPAKRSRLNLRKNRKGLLEQHKRNRPPASESATTPPPMP